jgi:hypothetical protein
MDRSHDQVFVLLKTGNEVEKGAQDFHCTLKQVITNLLKQKESNPEHTPQIIVTTFFCWTSGSRFSSSATILHHVCFPLNNPAQHNQVPIRTTIFP